MSIDYRIFPPGNHVRIVGKGNITPEECLELVNHVKTDPCRNSELTVLIDLRDAFCDPRDEARYQYCQGAGDVPFHAQ